MVTKNDSKVANEEKFERVEICKKMTFEMWRARKWVTCGSDGAAGTMYVIYFSSAKTKNLN